MPVLNGDREPTPEEQLSAVIRGGVLGTFDHLMERSTSGFAHHLDTLQAEDSADRLALELLAPRSVVVARLTRSGFNWRDASASAHVFDLLTEVYGLPLSVASQYAQVLIAAQRARTTFRQWLGE